MLFENQVLNTSPLLFGEAFWVVFKFLTLVLFGLYFVFSLAVLRQVNLMTETLITEDGPWMRAGAIIHSGFSLAVMVLFIGLLFS